MKMRKILASILVACLSITSGISAFASENVTSEKAYVVTEARMAEAQAEIDALDLETRFQDIDWNNATSYSEYEILEKLEKMPSSELKGNGYTAQEISTVRNFRKIMAENVAELKTLDKAQLSELGYTDSQIDAIQSFEGSNDELRAVSATASVSLDIDYCDYNASSQRTSSRLYFAWSWNGVPIIKMKDMMLIGWNEWVQAGKTGYVQYKHISNSTTKTQPPTYTASTSGEGYGGGYKFQAAIDDNYYYAQNGYCIFVVDTAGRKDMHAKGVFAHQTVGFEPSFSVTVTGSGVSPSITINLVNTTAEVTVSKSMRVSG